MNIIQLIVLIIVVSIIYYLFVEFKDIHNRENYNRENYKEVKYAPYNDVDGLYSNPPYLYSFFPSGLFWNSTRNTRNMIYDIRGDPFFPNF